MNVYVYVCVYVYVYVYVSDKWETPFHVPTRATLREVGGFDGVYVDYTLHQTAVVCDRMPAYFSI